MTYNFKNGWGEGDQKLGMVVLSEAIIGFGD
jgi:hypothetical protein